jgi:hypothetical protein
MAKTISDEELVQILWERVRKSSQKKVCAELQVGPAFMNDVLHGRRSITTRLAEALGYQRIVVYRKTA